MATRDNIPRSPEEHTQPDVRDEEQQRWDAFTLLAVVLMGEYGLEAVLEDLPELYGRVVEGDR